MSLFQPICEGGLLLKDERRELVPSAAALNARMVSSGLSMRLRVGLDRSGSAVADVNTRSTARVSMLRLTYHIALNVLVHHQPQVFNC